MIIYLIRHGHAEDRAAWHGPDIDRPLIRKGITRAEKAFRKFFSIYQKPDVIISSQAARALGTAEILGRQQGVGVLVRSAINPGAGNTDYASVLKEFDNTAALAVVGHEPDMSDFISYYLSDGILIPEFKKGSICHIENKCLINLIQQKVLL